MDTGKFTAAIRARLADLSKLRARTDAADAKIGEAATGMLGRVEEDIEKLRPRVHLDGDAADRFQERVKERGVLERIAK